MGTYDLYILARASTWAFVRLLADRNAPAIFEAQRHAVGDHVEQVAGIHRQLSHQYSVYIYTYNNIYIYIYMRVHTYIYIYVCIYIYIYIHLTYIMYIPLYTYIDTSIHTCTHVFVFTLYLFGQFKLQPRGSKYPILEVSASRANTRVGLFWTRVLSTKTPPCTSIEGLMVCIRWYLGFLKFLTGQLGGAGKHGVFGIWIVLEGTPDATFW